MATMAELYRGLTGKQKDYYKKAYIPKIEPTPTPKISPAFAGLRQARPSPAFSGLQQPPATRYEQTKLGKPRIGMVGQMPTIAGDPMRALQQYYATYGTTSTFTSDYVPYNPASRDPYNSWMNPQITWPTGGGRGGTGPYPTEAALSPYPARAWEGGGLAGGRRPRGTEQKFDYIIYGPTGGYGSDTGEGGGGDGGYTYNFGGSGTPSSSARYYGTGLINWRV